MRTIDSLQGEHRWLSNFWPINVFYEGRMYPSVENAYQAAKLHPSQRGQFLSCTPGQAKRAGRAGTIQPGWDDMKLGVMERLLAQKFFAGSALAGQLLATGDAKIVEGNTWGDTFWGVCRGKGENHLGRLLMARREELRDAHLSALI